MEKAIESRPREEVLYAKRLPIMRTLARLHECEVETLYESVDASEIDVQSILREMVSKKEVEASPGSRNRRFTLTLKGWGEYLNVLGSIYELPE